MKYVLTFIAGAGTLSGGASLVVTSSQRLLTLPTLLSTVTEYW